jgi:hypothetical protein
MKTELGLVIDARCWDAIMTEALFTANKERRITCHSERAANAGFANLLVWVALDSDEPMVLIRGES